MMLFRDPHAIVENFEQERAPEPEPKAKHECHGQIHAHVGLRRRAWFAGPVDDEHVVARHAGCHVNLLQAVEQVVIHAARGLDLALENVVSNAALLQIENLRAQIRHAFEHLLLLVLQRLVAGSQRSAHRLRFFVDLAIEFGNLLAERHHLRIARFERAELFLILLNEFAALLAQLRDRAAGLQLRKIDVCVSLNLAQELLLLDPLGRDLVQLFVGGRIVCLNN